FGHGECSVRRHDVSAARKSTDVRATEITVVPAIVSPAWTDAVPSRPGTPLTRAVHGGPPMIPETVIVGMVVAAGAAGVSARRVGSYAMSDGWRAVRNGSDCTIR